MILIFGAKGQVGGALMARLKGEAIGLDRSDCDLTCAEAIERALENFRPEAVINAAAYTAVDKAESAAEPAHAVNAEAPGVMARYCASRGIPFMHYSTDYVFDGSGDAPWREADAPHPLNHYGRTKRMGEEAVLAAGGRHVIFRTSWVYDSQDGNFFASILRAARERDELRVIADQHGAPTYAPHLARASLEALRRLGSGAQSGLYHLCGGGETTWYGFAEAIVAEARACGMPIKAQRVVPISSKEYPTPAARPHNSRLDCGKAKAAFGVALPSWQEGLRECMDKILSV